MQSASRARLLLMLHFMTFDLTDRGQVSSTNSRMRQLVLMDAVVHDNSNTLTKSHNPVELCKLQDKDTLDAKELLSFVNSR